MAGCDGGAALSARYRTTALFFYSAAESAASAGCESLRTEQTADEIRRPLSMERRAIDNNEITGRAIARSG